MYVGYIAQKNLRAVSLLDIEEEVSVLIVSNAVFYQCSTTLVLSETV